MAKQSNWKNFERKVAKKFWGKRIVRPDWGVNDLDVVAFPFGIECKYRKVINYDKALEQVEEIIRIVEGRQGLLPLAVVQKVGTTGKEEVVFRFKLLIQLGLVTGGNIHEDIVEEIWVVPLDRFLKTLDKAGVTYGKRPENSIEGGSEKSDRQSGIGGD